MKKSEMKNWVEGVHLLGIITLFVGPLIVYFAINSKEIRESAKIALNWQLSLLIYIAIASLIPIGFPVLFTGNMFYFWGGNFLVNILLVINVVFCVIAFAKATKNEKWDYPLSLKLF